MSIVLFDTKARENLFPLTYARAVADLRFGALTRRDWWHLVSGKKVFILTENYLQAKYSPIPEGKHLFIDATLLPDDELMRRILLLSEDRALEDDKGNIIAVHTSLAALDNFSQQKDYAQKRFRLSSVEKLQYPWDFFQKNDGFLRADFEKLTKGKKSEKLSKTNQVLGRENIFVEPGAHVEFATLNATTGPIYISKDAEIMEGTFLRGPVFVGSNAVVKMGAKIYGATTIGPNCVVGGEIKNTVLMSNSNKAHDGYLGDAVIGQWCNIGGGTTNSNLKNTAGTVLMWSPAEKKNIPVGKKAGVVLGDYSRVAINTSINTGSVYGVCGNIFGSGLLPKYIPNYGWGTDNNTKYKIENAIEDINRWMQLKGGKITPVEADILIHIFKRYT